MTDDVTIRLTHDQALMLSDWLHRVMGTPAFDEMINDDPAVWSPLHAIAGHLESTLAAIFSPTYGDDLLGARDRLLDQLGDLRRQPTAAANPEEITDNQ